MGAGSESYDHIIEKRAAQIRHTDDTEKLMKEYFDMAGLAASQADSFLNPKLSANAIAMMQAQQQANLAQVGAQLSKATLAQVGATTAPTGSGSAHKLSDMERGQRALGLLVGRLEGVNKNFSLKRGEFLHCEVHASSEHVFVFFLFNGSDNKPREGVVSEAVDIFPSDQLIAQFRMAYGS